MPNPKRRKRPVAAAANDEARFLDRRLRAGLWLILASTLVLPLLEVLDTSTAVLRLDVLVMQAVIVLIVLLRLTRGESESTRETLLAMTGVGLAIAGVGIARGDAVTPFVLLVVVAFVAATLLAWRPFTQFALVCALGGSAVLAAGFAPEHVHFGLAPGIALAVAFSASVYIAFELGGTRRRMAEQAEARERTAEVLRLVESAVEQANDAIVIMTPELTFPGPRIVYVNPAFCSMTGYTADEAIRQPLRALFGPGTTMAEITRLHESLRQDDSHIGQGTFHRKNGEPYVLEWHTALIRDAAGTVQYRMTVNRDVSERVRAESGRAGLLQVARSIGGRLETSEIFERVQRHLAELLSCARVASWVWDADTQAFRSASLQGFSPEQAERLRLVEHRPTEALRQQLLAGRTVVINEPVGQAMLPITIFSDYGLVALAIAPMHARGRMLGALVVANVVRGHRFDAAQVQLLEGIAQQTAIAWDAAELYRAQREDARVARALADAGEKMISSLSTPVLQQLLCEMTRRMLDGATSHTLLWRADDLVYEFVSQAGDSEEQWRCLRMLRPSAAELTDLFRLLRRAGLAEVGPDGELYGPLAPLLQREGLGASLCLPLRRGEEIVGCQIVHAAATHTFSDEQRRIARGLGQLASSALENARLVEETERANRLKSEFVATMSHELRTPLNVLIGYNELLLDGAYGDLSPDQVQPLGRADKAARELSDMIDSILDLNRLDKQHVPVSVELVSVADLIDEVMAEDRNLPDKANVTAARDIEEGLPQIRTDRIKLKMVIKNLFGNAVKFTEQGRIVLRARPVHPGIEIAVIDSGIGIAPEMQGLVFEPFLQVDGTDTRRYGGLGLGLYIVRRLVEVLGGTIEMESRLGEGSTFRVWIPLSLSEVAPPA